MGSLVDVSAIDTPSQILVFDSMSFIAESTGHVGPVKTYAPYRIVRFSNLEYIADSHGKLVIQGLVSCWA